VIRRKVVIQNRLGLHARAAGKLVAEAARHEGEIWLVRDGRRVNAKSIMGILMLAAGKGTELIIEAEDPGGQQACTALARLIAARFGEDD